MSDERELELIQRGADGLLGESEQAELARLLVRSPEARELHDQIGRLALLPSALPPVEPPPELKQSILDSLDPALYRKPRTQPSRLPFGATFQQLLSPKLAYGLAAGLMIGLALGFLADRGLRQGEMTPLDLSASISNSGKSERAAQIDGYPLGLKGLSGYVTASVSGDQGFLKLELSSESDVLIQIECPTGLRVHGLRQDVQTPPQWVLTPQAVSITHKGQNTYLLAFQRPAGKSISLTFYSAGGAIHKQEIAFPD